MAGTHRTGHHPNFTDLTGRTFGRLAVLSLDRVKTTNGTRWLCRCDCGNVTSVRRTNLVSGHTRSCGCIQWQTRHSGDNSRTHNLSHSREWGIYYKLFDRCHKPDNPAYHNYGGRGITVCPRWHESFENFYADMGPAPAGCQLDRIDNDKGYSADNCRWTDRRTNCRNRRGNVVLTYNGKTQVLAAWAEEIGMNAAVLGKRLINGWSVEDALTVPPCKSKYCKAKWKLTQKS